jgi:hypothetical protein
MATIAALTVLLLLSPWLALARRRPKRSRVATIP